ncbi:hypothetical protein FOZ63_009508, partial [Perkinsus olseni]
MPASPSTTVSPLTLILSVIAGLYVIWNYRAPTWTAVLREPPLNLTSSVSSTVEAEDTLEECGRRAMIGPSGEADGPRGKKVYIDLGANDGSSLKYFFTEFAPDTLGERQVNLSEWEAYLFDLNPLWKDDLRARCASFNDLARCEAILAGAWNSTKTIGYFHDLTVHDRADRKDAEARKDRSEWFSESVRGFVVAGVGEWKTDGCVVDFIGWVRRVVQNDHRQQVFLKVDIEGAEYTVVRELLDSGVLKGRVKWVAIEWHGKIVRKIKGFDHKARQEAIINDL